jgi:outer membrane lipoprotein-sorting protein
MISSAVVAAYTAPPAANTAAADPASPQLPRLTAAEIVARHVQARGGAQAWKTVQTMQLTGKMEAGRGDNDKRAEKLINANKKVTGKGNNAEVALASADVENDKQIELPFKLDLQRPNRMRLELAVGSQTAVQVFDGKRGWKYRPFLNRSDAEPYTDEENKAEEARGDLDGPLINYAAKGSKVELEGTDFVEAQPAYRLKVTLKSGTAQHVWIDAKSFLDVKVEGLPRQFDGKLRPVYVYQRDFRPVQGVVIPFVLETAVEGVADHHRVLIEQGAINPKFEQALFTKPGA